MLLQVESFLPRATQLCRSFARSSSQVLCLSEVTAFMKATRFKGILSGQPDKFAVEYKQIVSGKIIRTSVWTIRGL